MDAAAQYALAYALTTSAGLRGLLTLAAVSLAVHLGALHPPAAFAWLGSTTATVVLVAVGIVELIGDKIPVVDHAFHLVQVVVKPAAAAILVGGVVHAQNPAALYGLMALGALNALGVHATSAVARGTSTSLTAGAGNPVLSVVEDIAWVVMTVCSFLLPFAAVVLAIVVTLFIARSARSLWLRRRATATRPSG